MDQFSRINVDNMKLTDYGKICKAKCFKIDYG